MNSNVMDVHEELAEAPLAPFHIGLAAMLGGLIVFDGYDTVNPSYVVHYLAPAWHLTPSQGGLLVSSGLIGFLVGAAGHGTIADKYGRRGVLLGALWLATLCTLLTPVLGTSLLFFCLIRIATGVGLGVLLPLATTYMNEYAPRRYANTLPIWGVTLGWALGATAASFAGIFLTPRFGWQSLYYLGGCAFFLLGALHFGLPESAKYLALCGRTDEVRALLSRVRPGRTDFYRNAALRPPVRHTSQGNIAALIAAGYRRVTFTIWIAAFLSLFGVYALSGWIPSVMIQRGESFAAGFGFGAIMQIASFVGGLLGAYLIDRSGAATRWMAALWICGAVAVGLLTVVNTHAFNTVGVAIAGFGIPGAQFLLNNYTARTYETSIRASGVGMELAVGRLGAILGPYVAGLLQQIYHSPQAMFIAVAAAAMVAGIAILTLSTGRLSITDPNVGPSLVPGEYA
jgi:MFS family permease